VEDNSLVYVLFIGIFAGALVGFWIGQWSGGRSTGNSGALKKAQQDLSDYKKEVETHFETTADLVNKMTESYRDVYKHLASGAKTLCADEAKAIAIAANMAPQLEAKPVQQEEREEAPSTEAPKAEAPQEDVTAIEKTDVVEPRDYAPKKPDEEGTLSETYSLKKEPTLSADDTKSPETK
jgi:uncharacterized membrane-anchored protein YhcB (DUF1043 family)